MNLTIVCFLAALLVGVGNLKAQDERRDYADERLRLRAEWMALDMAERYGLDQKQVKELTEANLTWLQQRGETGTFRPEGRRRGDVRRHYRHHQGHRHGGCCDSPRYDDYCCEGGYHSHSCAYDDRNGQAPLTKEELEKRRSDRKQAWEERKAARDAYEQSLQKIMTEDQYKAYQERRR